MISIEDAFKLIAEAVSPLPTAHSMLADSVGRVLADDVTADVDSPPHRKSVMDGFAIKSRDLKGAGQSFKIAETIVAGGWPNAPLADGEAARIMTGAPLPDGADAVIMIEKAKMNTVDGVDFVEFSVDRIDSGKHVMERGVNFAKGDTLFRRGHRIRPTDVGLLAEVGCGQPLTGRLPSVAVLPTGDELVDSQEQPGRGQIRNSNGPMLLAMAKGLGLKTIDLGIGRDNRSELKAAIRKGLGHDMLVLSGGVSAGVLDLVPGILAEEGVVEVFHKVKVKPGKPIWFGVLTRDQQKTYVFGLPGNPVSSLVGFQLFVRTAIRILESDRSPKPRSVSAQLAKDHETRGDRPTYWPGRWVEDQSNVRKVEPLVWRGSSDLVALGSADGLIYFPSDTNQHPARIDVMFFPF